MIREPGSARNRKVMIDALNYAPANSPKELRAVADFSNSGASSSPTTRDGMGFAGLGNVAVALVRRADRHSPPAGGIGFYFLVLSVPSPQQFRRGRCRSINRVHDELMSSVAL